jgi:hypothetical protein
MEGKGSKLALRAATKGSRSHFVSQKTPFLRLLPLYLPDRSSAHPKNGLMAARDSGGIKST